MRWRLSSRSAFECSRKRCARMRAKATSECNSVRSPRPILGSRSGAIRSSIRSTGPTRMWCCAPAMPRSSRRPNVRSRKCWSECGEHNQIAEAHPSTRASSPRDVLCAVTDCSKHLITFRGWRAAKEGPAKKRVHVFPDDLSFFGNFEETAEGGLSDQCIAIRQTLRIAHPGREEIPGRLILVLPCDLVCGWIDLDHSRIRHRVVETVRPIIEYQDIAVLEQRWPMLSGNRGRAEFPDDFSRLAGDANDCGGGAITRQDVAVGQLIYAVALRPKRARGLHLGDAIRRRIEMLPCPPLPDRLPLRSNLGQIIGVHLAGVCLWSRSITARLHVVLQHASSDPPGDVVGHLRHAMQQHVAVAQQNAVMMMVRMPYFPQHLAVPVGFQDNAAFERKAAQKALLGRAPVVEERPALGEIAGQAGRVRHFPGVYDLALQVDEVYVAVLHEVWSKQRKSRSDALWLARAQPDAPSLESVLLDRGHELLTSRGG